jgi:hypothetical protein
MEQDSRNGTSGLLSIDRYYQDYSESTGLYTWILLRVM